MTTTAVPEAIVWDTKEGRDLLWQAYPMGYLAKPGVVTVRGWWMLGAVSQMKGPQVQRVLHPDFGGAPELDSKHVDPHIRAGDLLPDPRNSNTWQAMLADLYGAPVEPGYGLGFRRQVCKESHGKVLGWQLIYVDAYATNWINYAEHLVQDVEDPYEALVRLLIRKREQQKAETPA